VEQQAVDRVHRLGQTKEVTTTRFIIKNSIEENMQERQKYKTALAQKALDEEDSGQIIGGKRRKRAGVKDKEEILQEKMKSLAILFH
jgi:SNF2 family DNA or RNA helicase